MPGIQSNTNPKELNQLEDIYMGKGFHHAQAWDPE